MPAMRSPGSPVQSCMGHEASLGIGRQYSIKYPATMIFFNCHTGFRFHLEFYAAQILKPAMKLFHFFLELKIPIRDGDKC